MNKNEKFQWNKIRIAFKMVTILPPFVIKRKKKHFLKKQKIKLNCIIIGYWTTCFCFLFVIIFDHFLTILEVPHVRMKKNCKTMSKYQENIIMNIPHLHALCICGKKNSQRIYVHTHVYVRSMSQYTTYKHTYNFSNSSWTCSPVTYVCFCGFQKCTEEICTSMKPAIIIERIRAHVFIYVFNNYY